MARLTIRGQADEDIDEIARAIAKDNLEAGKRFYDAVAGSLFDVVDVDHRPGVVDAAFRPNQIFAAGGLPFPLLPRERACDIGGDGNRKRCISFPTDLLASRDS